MRKTGTINIMLTMLLIGMLSMNAEAQRRRDSNSQQNHQQDHNDRDRSRENNNRDRDHNNNRDKYSYDGKHDHYDRHDRNHDRHHHREVRHVHHVHKPSVVHHYHAGRPRYVYFRDYDVYYDCHRNTYISYSGRGWNVTTIAPFSMRNVNVRTARSYEVDYYDDDFPTYLQRRRPSCGQQYRGW